MTERGYFDLDALLDAALERQPSFAPAAVRLGKEQEELERRREAVRRQFANALAKIWVDTAQTVLRSNGPESASIGAERAVGVADRVTQAWATRFLLRSRCERGPG